MIRSREDSLGSWSAHGSWTCSPSPACFSLPASTPTDALGPAPSYSCHSGLQLFVHHRIMRYIDRARREAQPAHKQNGLRTVVKKKIIWRGRAKGRNGGRKIASWRRMATMHDLTQLDGVLRPCLHQWHFPSAAPLSSMLASFNLFTAIRNYARDLRKTPEVGSILCCVVC